MLYPKTLNPKPIEKGAILGMKGQLDEVGNADVGLELRELSHSKSLSKAKILWNLNDCDFVCLLKISIKY